MNKNPIICSQKFPYLVAALEEFQINTSLRIAAYLGQVLHESGEFRYVEEIWIPTSQQNRYDPPSRLSIQLGNTHTGDGFVFRGRGDLMITGRANYRKYGLKLNLNLELNPDLASTLPVASRVGGVYWTDRGLNELADQGQGSFDKITLQVNGGYNGKSQRDFFYQKALSVLQA